MQITHAHNFDCIINNNKREELATLSARTVWIVHSQYKGTVKSKYVDIVISMAYIARLALAIPASKVITVWLARA